MKEKKPRTWRTRFTRDQLQQLGLAFDARLAGLEQALRAASKDAADRIKRAEQQQKRAERRVAVLEARLKRQRR